MKSLAVIKNNISQLDINNGFKCRCCNDKMPIKEKKFFTALTGIKTTIIKKAKRKPFLRRSNCSQEKLDKHIEILIDTIKNDNYTLEKINKKVTKEMVAKIFDVPEHQVKISFHKLNLLGKLSRGSNIPPHDSRRDFWGGSDSSWLPTQYTIL